MTATADTTHTDAPPAGHFGGRFVAWTGFAFGSVVSIAANWLAAWLGDNGPDWTPSVATQVGAAVWPVALLISVEVLSRVAWGTGWGWALVRFGGVGVVGLGSGVISYGHIHAVLRSWGYDALGAMVGPLVIDGLMIVSGFALLAMNSTTAADTTVAMPAAAPEVDTPAAHAAPKQPRPQRPETTAGAAPKPVATPVHPTPGVATATTQTNVRALHPHQQPAISGREQAYQWFAEQVTAAGGDVNKVSGPDVAAQFGSDHLKKKITEFRQRYQAEQNPAVNQ